MQYIDVGLVNLTVNKPETGKYGTQENTRIESALYMQYCAFESTGSDY